MKKSYIITKATDAYHASRCVRGGRVLRWDGGTPVEWVHDDNFGRGFTLEEARKELNGYYLEDKQGGSEGISHRYFDNSYTSDVYTYSIVEMRPVYCIHTLSQFADYINEYTGQNKCSWIYDAEEIIEANDWENECESEDGKVCNDGYDRVVLNEQGKAEVVEMDNE